MSKSTSWTRPYDAGCQPTPSMAGGRTAALFLLARQALTALLAALLLVACTSGESNVVTGNRDGINLLPAAPQPDLCLANSYFINNIRTIAIAAFAR